MKTKRDPASVDLSEALSSLRADRDAIPWPERQQIVARIAGPLSEGEAIEPFRSLLLLLAEDPKWEVRKDVADVLAATLDNELAALAQTLKSDSNRYVRTAAEHSIERRRKKAREAQKQKRGVDLVLALYQELENDHGKVAADKARRLAEQLYDTLIGATAHEMRSVMTALKDDSVRLVQHLEAGQLDPASLIHRSRKIAARVEFMERLVRDMRNYAQPVSDDRVEVTIADLLTEARSIVSETLRARNNSPRKVLLDVTVPADLKVKVSRVHIVTAIVNVLQNAYDFLLFEGDGPRGQIRIRVTRHGKHAVIAVRDSGVGIPAANLDEVRQCLPGRTSRRHTGTGFGLCNAMRFVEAHGGTLRIDSKENDGTTVTLTLPIE